MKDVMEQLRAAQPMPRGERLATMLDRRTFGTGRLRHWCHSRTLPNTAYKVRLHAAPLALARERRRRERAERIADERKAELFKAWADEQATSAMCHERGREIDALRAEVERLRAGHTCREGDRVDCLACDTYMRTVYLLPPPTREEVERAVDALLEAPEKCGDMDAARDALVALATRGKA